MIKSQDISPLFESMTRRKISVQYNERMYPIKEIPEENWLYYSFEGFKILDKKRGREGKSVKSFASIGSGNGVDALGASYIFKEAEDFYLTDIDQRVLPFALANFRNNTGREPPPNVSTLAGDLAQPLIKKGIKCDLVYANLPNIPLWDKSQKMGFGLSTFYDSGSLKDSPPIINDFLLSLQYRLLRTVGAALEKNGCVTLMIGGRVPSKCFDILFKAAGFSLEPLCAGFKVQTETKEVLEGYSRAEKTAGVEFTFYNYDNAAKSLGGLGNGFLVPGEQIDFFKKNLSGQELTANQALKEYLKGARVGHTCHALAGRTNKANGGGG